jgi:hypothetical protein
MYAYSMTALLLLPLIAHNLQWLQSYTAWMMNQAHPFLPVSLLCRNDSSGIHSHEKIKYNIWTLFHNTHSHTTRSKGKGRKAVACAVIPATGNRRTAAAIPRSHFFTAVAVDLNRLAEYASSRKKNCEKSHCLAQQKFSK